MFKIAICDDEIDEINKIYELLVSYSIKNNYEFIIDKYSDPVKLLQDYHKGKYNIIFLDVEMNGKDGIDIAGRIRQTPDKEVVVVYVSSYPQYMQSCFSVNAAHFFTKPLEYDSLEKRLSEILEYFFESGYKVLCIETEDAEFIYINETDIVLLQVENKGTKGLKILCDEQTYYAKGYLKDMYEKLKEKFILVNRSTLINPKYVSRIVNTDIVLKEDIRVTVSRRKLQLIKGRIMDILEGKNK